MIVAACGQCRNKAFLTGWNNLSHTTNENTTIKSKEGQCIGVLAVIPEQHNAQASAVLTVVNAVLEFTFLRHNQT